MIAALKSLKAFVSQPHLLDKMAAFGISDSKRKGLSALFATHPDIDGRIKVFERSVYPYYK